MIRLPERSAIGAKRDYLNLIDYREGCRLGKGENVILQTGPDSSGVYGPEADLGDEFLKEMDVCRVGNHTKIRYGLIQNKKYCIHQLLKFYDN
jgi:hypothetical protein